MRAFIIGVVSFLSFSCTAEGVTVRDPNGEFSFLADDAPEEEREESGKVLWAFGAVRVAAQRVPRTSYNRGLSLAEVAAALSERFEFEDIEGSVEASPCTADGRAIQCLDGWTESESGRVQRRGLLFGSDDELVLVEVIGDGGRVDEVFERLLQSFRWPGELDG
ncbi:MAG: hypothetical protein DRJ42_31530 [Deltaproteobacteria bacterium]|nr:MAG: hypothetical protein DRJ42_31530 [Deltaproteobacteria bacterium]